MKSLFKCAMDSPKREVPVRVRMAFNAAGKGKDYLSVRDLASFLSAQGEANATEEHAAQIMSCFPFNSTTEVMNIHSFLDFLLDPAFNSPLHVIEKPIQDMSAPLSHYYIYSGHNSYLTGNQLTSKSSTAPIADALQAGCRVIELDCWERKGRIVVLHGKTLTKAVPFEDCLQAIKENAFKASDYPVIITIENHLPPSLQKEAAKMIKEAFGETLYLPYSEDRPPKEFASPESLKRKILISDAPFPDSLKKEAADDPETVVDVVSDIITGHDVIEEPESPSISLSSLRYKVKKEFTKKLGVAANATANCKELDDSEEGGEQGYGELEELIYISCEKPKEMKDTPVNGQLVLGERSIMANLSEPQLKKYIKRNAGSIVEFTQRNLGRVYPFGLRIDSSNADPFLAWVHGIQLAAINMQGQDRPCWLCQAFFSVNGKCGYVKKPDILLNQNFNLENIEHFLPKLILKIKILMGCDWQKRFDFLKKPDYYVKLALHGMPVDETKKKTDISHKTLEPNWEDQVFEFSVRVPEIAVLRLEVWEREHIGRGDFVGQACFPLMGLKSGLRAIGLQSSQGIMLRSKLLCSIEIERVETVWEN